LKKDSPARGQGKFALVGENVLKVLEIKLDKRGTRKACASTTSAQYEALK